MSEEATETIISSRAVSTRRLYALKSGNCLLLGVDVVIWISFSEGITPGTLKVYVAAISSNHAYIDSVSVSRHPLVSRFM